MIRIIDIGDRRRIRALLDRPRQRDAQIERRVAAIVARVGRDGDRAVLHYARRFDRLADPMEVSRAEMTSAAGCVPADLRRALEAAARHIAHVSARQLPRAFQAQPVRGVSIEQRVTPLDAVGCYVPGGRFPLLSSLLMTAIPARVAGVREIVAVCPRPDRTVMAAALEAGVTRLFRVGGAHGVAALAFGTESVPRVDKIVGPGNAYVAAAKAAVSRFCAIDFLAGPSEILVISVDGNPVWIAADLIAQAEHDPDARAVLVTPSRRLAHAVARELRRQMPREGVARTSISGNGGLVVARDLDDAIAFGERMAPEHVVCDSDAIAAKIRRAGTIFVGRYSAQAAGDYMTGSNHVLPTGGAARARGGLSAADFVRVSTVQRLTRPGLEAIAANAVALATAEGLRAHAASIAMRLSRP